MLTSRKFIVKKKAYFCELKNNNLTKHFTLIGMKHWIRYYLFQPNHITNSVLAYCLRLKKHYLI